MSTRGAPPPQLEPRQERAIIALLTEPTFKRAAEVVGVAEKTIHRWMEDPGFSAAYRRARRLAFNQAIAATQRYVPVAIQALARITVDEKAPHAARVSAASAILRFSRDSLELDDLAERIGALEAQLNGKVTVNAARGMGGGGGGSCVSGGGGKGNTE